MPLIDDVYRPVRRPPSVIETDAHAPRVVQRAAPAPPTATTLRPAQPLSPSSAAPVIPRPSVTAPAPAASAAPSSPPRPLFRRLLTILEYPLVAALAIIAAAQPAIGQWFVLGYGVIALVLRLSSRLSFGTALMLLASIPLFQFLKQDNALQNIALYAYELLALGTLQTLIAVWLRFRKRNFVRKTTVPTPPGRV